MIKVTLEFPTIEAAQDALAKLSPIKGDVASPKPVSPKPAAAPTAPAAPAAPPASSTDAAAPTAQQVTNAVVAAVAKAGKEKVIALLRDDFGVSAGKEITDPETRVRAIAALGALGA